MPNKFLQILTEMLALQRSNSKKELMTIDDVSATLGLSNSYLYQLTSQKLIPHYKPLNKTIFFKRSELMKWIEKGKVPTNDEIFNNYSKDSSSATYFKRKKDSNSGTSKKTTND